jgi:TatA/E family protein of Tat protein translocase
MFGIGLPELIIIFIIALIVFGPKKLPDLAKSMGKGLAEFKKASNELKNSMESDLKVDLNDETYSPEVSSPAEPLTPSEGKPPTLEGPPADQTSTPDSYLENLERGKIEVAQGQEVVPPEDTSDQFTLPLKEEDQPVAAQEARRNIG